MSKKQAKAVAEKENGSGAKTYRKISGGSFPENWDYKKNPLLVGKVTEKKKVPFKRGKKTEEVFVVSVAQQDTGEIVTVWESHALGAFMDEVKQGDEVKIEFKGVRKMKGKKTLKDFDAFIA